MTNNVKQNCADAHDLLRKENFKGVEEYLTIKGLSKRIKYKKQTLYNYIYNGKFILGKHYIKPSPKKILFIWSAIHTWMGDTTTIQLQKCNDSKEPKKNNKKERFQACVINI